MRILAILLGLCFSSTGWTQDYKFGKVSKEELEEKFNPLDSSASATYLYKYRDTHFEYSQEEGFQVVTEMHERIKIYNQEGFNYATKAVRLHKNGSDQESINSIKAYTYNLVEGKIEDIKLDKKGIFKTEKSRYSNETKFTMPNIKVGSVVEYKYKMYSPFTHNIEDFVFQHSIPIKKIDAKFEAPEYFNFKLNTKGYLSVIPKKESESDKIVFSNRTRTRGQYNTISTNFSQSEIDFVKSIDKYSLSNIPALKKEPYVNNINNYKSAVKYELSYTKFPNSIVNNYSTTWEDVVKTIYKSPDFGEELKKTGYFKDEIDALIGSVSAHQKRADLIFNYVKSKMKWNGYYGYYVNDGVKKAFKEQVGNVAEINLMLTAMLSYAGLRAYPVLVSTRKHGVPLFPTREGYNYVVSCIKNEKGIVLLDATGKYSIPDVLPYRTLNWQGRIITDHGNSTLIDLYPKNISKKTISMIVNLDEEGTIVGNYRNLETDHRALSYRKKYNEVNKDDYLEKLENRYNGIEVSEFEVKNDLDLSKPIIESYKFEKENQADIIGDKMYFSPLFFLKTNENPFKLEKREYPVDFGYPSQTLYRVTVNLPEGYKIESLPKLEAFKLPDNLGSFKYQITGQDKLIQIIVSSKINTSVVPPSYYETLKLYFKQLVEKEAEQIVITKI